MKIPAMTAVALVCGTAAWGKTNKADNVQVCIERGAHAGEIDPATMMASRMFGAIGVKVEWHDDRLAVPGIETSVCYYQLSVYSRPSI